MKTIQKILVATIATAMVAGGSAYASSSSNSSAGSGSKNKAKLVREVCVVDIKQHCKAQRKNSTMLLKCLKKNKKNLQSKCRSVVYNY